MQHKPIRCMQWEIRAYTATERRDKWWGQLASQLRQPDHVTWPQCMTGRTTSWPTD